MALAACLLLMAGAPRSARAQAAAPDFRWTAGDTTGGPFAVAPAATIEVPLYLQSITPAGAALLAGENGLFGAGLSVRRSADGGAGGAAATIAAVVADRAGFDDADPTARFEEVLSATLGRIKEQRDQPNGTGSMPAGADRRVRVGTVTITGGDAGDSASFELHDFVNAVGQLSTSFETVTGEGTPIDSRIAPGSLMVTTVPEPTACGLSALALAHVLLRRRRQRLRQP